MIPQNQLPSNTHLLFTTSHVLKPINLVLGFLHFISPRGFNFSFWTNKRIRMVIEGEDDQSCIAIQRIHYRKGRLSVWRCLFTKGQGLEHIKKLLWIIHLSNRMATNKSRWIRWYRNGDVQVYATKRCKSSLY